MDQVRFLTEKIRHNIRSLQLVCLSAPNSVVQSSFDNRIGLNEMQLSLLQSNGIISNPEALPLLARSDFSLRDLA